jgi:hypothetical protein
MKYSIIALLACLVLFAGCRPAAPQMVDKYLESWDRFAQGDNTLVPYLRDNRQHFESQLCRLWDEHPTQAVGRVVFYAVVQVGGYIDADSELGVRLKRLDPALAVTEAKQGKRVFFAGDLYFWWMDHRSEFESYDRFEEWSRRPFAKNVAIKLYERARENERKKG